MVFSRLDFLTVMLPTKLLITIVNLKLIDEIKLQQYKVILQNNLTLLPQK
jgi:hypothetical protein